MAPSLYGPTTRHNGKFDSRGKHVIFVGYLTNQQNFASFVSRSLPHQIVASNNLVFCTCCPHSMCSSVELHDDTQCKIPLSAASASLT